MEQLGPCILPLLAHNVPRFVRSFWREVYLRAFPMFILSAVRPASPEGDGGERGGEDVLCPIHYVNGQWKLPESFAAAHSSSPEEQRAMDERFAAHCNLFAARIQKGLRWMVPSADDGAADAAVVWREIGAVVSQWQFNFPLFFIRAVSESFLSENPNASPPHDIDRQRKISAVHAKLRDFEQTAQNSSEKSALLRKSCTSLERRVNSCKSEITELSRRINNFDAAMQCPICLQSLFNLRVLAPPCGHLICASCAEAWASHHGGVGGGSCPYCRASFSGALVEVKAFHAPR